MSPLFSIIVPVYNSRPYLAQCVDSLLGQTLSDREIILVDDGSSDGSIELCRQYTAQGVTFIENGHRGVSAARNAGLAAAKGEWVVFVDSDDICHADMLECFAAQMGETRCDMLVARIGRFLDGEEQGCDDANYPAGLPEGALSVAEVGERFPELYRVGLLSSPCARCYRRVLISEGFDEGISIGEDLLFNLSFLCCAETVVFMSRALYRYRVGRQGTLSSGSDPKKMTELTEVYRRMLSICEKLWGFPEEGEAVRAVDEKYLLNITTLSLRAARDTAYTRRERIDCLREHIEGTELEMASRNLGVLEIKFRLAAALLLYRRFGLFCCLAKL